MTPEQKARGRERSEYRQVSPLHRYQFLAGYYRWLAQRGMARTGNDPMTGRPLSVRGGLHAWENELVSTVAHKAMAREYLRLAAAQQADRR